MCCEEKTNCQCGNTDTSKCCCSAIRSLRAQCRIPSWPKSFKRGREQSSTKTHSVWLYVLVGVNVCLVNTTEAMMAGRVRGRPRGLGGNGHPLIEAMLLYQLYTSLIILIVSSLAPFRSCKTKRYVETTSALEISAAQHPQ